MNDQMSDGDLETLRLYAQDKHPASECPMTCGEVMELLARLYAAEGRPDAL